MEDDNLFDDSMTSDITCYADIRGVKYSEIDRIRRIEKASDRELLVLKEACRDNGTKETLALVEREQRKRFKKLVPGWKTAAFWFGLVGAITGIGGLVVAIIALTR